VSRLGRAFAAGSPLMAFRPPSSAGAAAAVPRLMDLVLWTCTHKIPQPGVIFTLLEQLVEAATISDAEAVFAYVEGQQAALRQPDIWDSGKLIMLRTCNGFLQRLSKSRNTVLCGRVLVLLAHLYPLSERSALNLAGNVNKATVTGLDAPELAAELLASTKPEASENSKAGGAGAAAEESDLAKKKKEKEKEKEKRLDALLTPEFYATFWGLQSALANPAKAMADWDKVSKDLERVLKVFEKHKAIDSSGVSGGSSEGSGNLGVMYLTSAKLLSLQMRDPQLRRQVLVQAAIVLYNVRWNAAGAAAAGAAPPKVTAEMAAPLLQRVKKVLAATPPEGKKFVEAVFNILEREENWVSWKKNKAPSFEKAPEKLVPARPKMKRLKAGVRMGNPELDRLWNLSADNESVLAMPEGTSLVPSCEEFLEPIRDDVDPEAGIEEEYKNKHDKVFCWKALRLVARVHLASFLNYTNIEDVACQILDIKPPVKADDEAKEQATEGARKDGDEAAAEDEEGGRQPMEEEAADGDAEEAGVAATDEPQKGAKERESASGEEGADVAMEEAPPPPPPESDRSSRKRKASK